jgi:predicted permease
MGMIDVTPGMMSVLSIAPSWGRSFAPDDATVEGRFHVLLGENLARELFGQPEAAVGQRLETSHLPLVVVGVMPAAFRFPDGGPQIWRALPLRGPLTEGRAGFETIGRLAPGVVRQAASMVVQSRSASIRESAGLAASGGFLIADADVVAARSEEWALSWLFLGGALVLLAIACANIAGVEAAALRRRSRSVGLQHALGASRTRIASVVLLEGALVMGGALLAALGLTVAGLEALLSILPPRLLTYSANSIDVDLRSFAFMTAAAAVTWLLCAIPGVSAAMRPSLNGVLGRTGPSTAFGRQRTRRLLTSVQVGAVVVLLVAGAALARSYFSLLGVDKGFDSANVVAITASFPNQARADRARVIDTLIERLQALDSVQGVTPAIVPPGFGENHFDLRIGIDGSEADSAGRPVAFQAVDPAYFSILNVPLRNGRFLIETDPPAAAVISEDFARAYWPGIDPIGRTFSLPRRAPFQVVGVMGNMADVTGAITGRQRLLFFHGRPPPAPAPPAAEEVDDGDSWGYLSVMARLDSRERAGAAIEVARSIDPRFAMRLEFVDDAYAEAFGPYLLGARLIGSIALLAFAVALTGIYGVMASLVADRRRELGVRMALGATRRDLYQLVMGSAARMSTFGAAGGGLLAYTVVAFAVTTIPGLTGAGVMFIGSVTGLVVLTALLATWQPARQAARVDPAITLRAE